MRPIDADALKEHICNSCDGGERECKGDESCALLVWVNDMPTIEAEPVRQGEWIIKPHGTYNQLRAYCSYCGKHSGIGGIISNQLKPYCPNCGAEMKVKKCD